MQSEHVLFQLISVVSYAPLWRMWLGLPDDLSHRYRELLWGPSKAILSPGWTSPIPHQTAAPALTISMAPPEPDPFDQCLVLRVSNLDGQSRYSLVSVETKEIITSLNLLAVLLPTQLMIPSLLPGHITCSSSAHFPPAPQGLLPKVAPQPVSDSMFCCKGLILPRCRTAFVLVEFWQILASPFLSPVQVFLDGSPVLQCTNRSSPSLESLGVHSITSSMLLMKMLHRTGLRTAPWSTLLITGLQEYFDPLTTTLWVQLSSQFLPIKLPTYPDRNILTWIQEYCIQESLARVEANYIHWCPLTPKSSYLIIADNQVGWAWFTLGKSMLTVTNHPQSFHCWNGIKKCLPHILTLKWNTSFTTHTAANASLWKR